VTPDRDSQAVKFIKPDVVNRSGFSVREYHGLTDKLGLRFLELAEDRGRADLHSWHGRPGFRV
jgi:hypothetical protein